MGSVKRYALDDIQGPVQLGTVLDFIAANGTVSVDEVASHYHILSRQAEHMLDALVKFAVLRRA